MIFFMNSSDANYKRLFFDYSINNINGKEIKLSEYKENVILVVNVASYCGFTKQYEDLQNLWEKYKGKGLIVLGIPSIKFSSYSTL